VKCDVGNYFIVEGEGMTGSPRKGFHIFWRTIVEWIWEERMIFQRSLKVPQMVII
jgi:hypothetical protein